MIINFLISSLFFTIVFEVLSDSFIGQKLLEMQLGKNIETEVKTYCCRLYLKFQTKKAKYDEINKISEENLKK